MVRALDGQERRDLAHGIAALEPALDRDERRATLAAYGLLAGGQAVTASSLAQRTGWSRERAERLLSRQPRVDRDDLGRVIGLGGISLSSTLHAITVGHQVLYGWSALDCLAAPALLDAAVHVRSRCPETDRDIELVALPESILQRDPEGTVVSLTRPQETDPDLARGGFRSLVRFLTDEAAATRWTGRVTGSFVISLDDAFAVARAVVATRFDPLPQPRPGDAGPGR